MTDPGEAARTAVALLAAVFDGDTAAADVLLPPDEPGLGQAVALTLARAMTGVIRTCDDGGDGFRRDVRGWLEAASAYGT